MEAAAISAVAALSGSAIGALSSFATTWITQRNQDSWARAALESSRRERLYGEFMEEAAKLFADALAHTMDNPGKLVSIYATIGKLRLFADERVVASTDLVMEEIIEAYYRPNEDFSTLAPDVDKARYDLLRPFALACRQDLLAGH